MRLLRRLVPGSITGQIAAIVAVSVMLGFALIAAIVLFLFTHGFRQDPAMAASPLHLVLAPTVLTLVIALVFVMLLSVYAVRWIVAPLSAVAAAAHSFGLSPSDDRALSRRGPREIAQLADALDDMRTRIRALLADRTRMLAAISHDLRTPLTRLRLRAERIDDPELRDGMLLEIERIARMLDETLDFLRDDRRAGEMTRLDLPSLLQTVCAEFIDVGHAVTYNGPVRLTWVGRAGALARAVSNIVDNAVKFGAKATVSLRGRDDGGVEIAIADDGPGMAAEVRERAFEPFFKADEARAVTGDGGFGLGLSIARDVVNGHGGQIVLREGTPRGLVVRILLPPAFTAPPAGNIS